MKFTLYLDAVRYCLQNKLSTDEIQRHGFLWKCHWTVVKPRKKKEPNATVTSRKTTKQVRSA